MELNIFTKEELDVIRALVQRSIEHAVAARIPLEGSALSPQLLSELYATNTKTLLTLYSISSKIDLLKGEE